jgi:hypothetical protein
MALFIDDCISTILDSTMCNTIALTFGSIVRSIILITRYRAVFVTMQGGATGVTSPCRSTLINIFCLY